MVSVGAGVSRIELRYSRRTAQRGERPLGPSLTSGAARIRAASTPLMDWMRMGTMGTGSRGGTPAARMRPTTASRWSSWMSMRTTFGRSAEVSTRSWPSRLSCTRYSVSSRNAPKPMARTTTTVWLAGRWRLASPCRHTYGQRAGTLLRTTRVRSHDASHSAPRATPTPAANPSPARTVGAWRVAMATVAPASSAAASSRAGSLRSGTRPSAARRITTSGETWRMASRGRAANSRATVTPTPTPQATARHDGSNVVTATGRRPVSTRGSSACAPMPIAAPATLPTRASAPACSR